MFFLLKHTKLILLQLQETHCLLTSNHPKKNYKSYKKVKIVSRKPIINQKQQQ